MTNKFLHFTLFLTFMFAVSLNIQAQKFLEKGDLKPVINNVIIWYATHTEVELDHSNNTGMGQGTFEGGTSGTETSGNESTSTSDNTDNHNNDITIDDNDSNGDNEEIDANEDGNDNTIFSNGGLLTENPLPSRGGDAGDHSGSTEGDNDGSETNTNDGTVGEIDTDNSSNTHAENVLEDKWENVLEKITNYPNPAIGHINIEVPNTDEVIQIRLINLAGQPAISQTATGNSRLILDTYHLPEGVYLLEFTGETKQIYRRTYIKK